MPRSKSSLWWRDSNKTASGNLGTVQIAAVKVLNSERAALTERLKVDEAEGAALSSTLDRDQTLALRPRMINVNSLIENLRASAKRGFEESGDALDRLQEVLRDKVGLTYKLESTVKPKEPTS